MTNEELDEIERLYAMDEFDTADVPRLIAAARELNRVREKMLATADGVLLLPEMDVWKVWPSDIGVEKFRVAGYRYYRTHSGEKMWTAFFDPTGFDTGWQRESCYSTEAAALAAAEKASDQS